ncbi:MAG: tetratricopeptide repeat protein, partial [Betaproteobacteria bacterium]
MSAPGGENGCAALVTLAWHLRQRDCPRALALATQADALLAGMDEGASERRRLSARLALVRGEISLLFDDLEAAQRCAQAAATAFAEIDDAIGEGDTHWLQASIGLNQGQGDHVEACLNLAMGEYRRGADPLRVQAAQARQLVYAAFRDTAGAAASLERLFPLGQSQPASVLAWLAAARANVGGLTGNPGMAIKHGLEAYQAARDSGQLRQALVSVTNAAESIATMGDLDAALEWSERAVALARRTGWPAIVGFCLMQLGDALRQIARHDEARALLQEALALVERQSGSRNYAQVLGSLGQLALEQGDHADALVWFARLGAHAHVHLEPDLLIKAGRGQASALVHLGRAQEARHMAEVALNLAREQGDAQGQIQMHAVLANMHAKHSLSEPAEMTAPTPALHHLKQALRIAADIDGYTVAPELFTQLAAAHAVVGNYRSAYDCTLSSEAARSKRHTEEAKKRALAMQIRNEVEHARAETELHRQLAATLQESTATLEILGAVGREITASLDAQAVFAALHRHVQELLDATVFAVYLIGDDGATLHTAFGVEAGVNLPARSVPIDSPTSQ